MIHADKLEEIFDEQVSLTEAAEQAGDDPLSSYLSNMGICPDCLLGIGTAYCVHNERLDMTDLAAFIRGFTVGLVLGRQHPTVEG